MLNSERAVTSMAKWLVFLFKQIIVRYPLMTDSESGHDRFLFTVDCLGCVAHSPLSLVVFFRFCLWFHCSRVPARLCQCIGLSCDQQKCERTAKLDVKAAFASLSALSFPVMPTCKIHAMIICICGGNFWRRLQKRLMSLVRKVFSCRLSTAEKMINLLVFAKGAVTSIPERLSLLF